MRTDPAVPAAQALGLTGAEQGVGFELNFDARRKRSVLERKFDLNIVRAADIKYRRQADFDYVLPNRSAEQSIHADQRPNRGDPPG